MKIEDLEDKGIKRLALHESVIEGKSEYVTIRRPDSDRKQKIEYFSKAGQLQNAILERAMAEARNAEQRIRKCRATTVSGVQKQKFEKEVRRELVKKIAGLTVGQLKQRLDKIFELRKAAEKEKPDYSKTTATLLKLEQMKLRHALTDESDAMTRLREMQKSGYDETEMLVLAAKGPRANKRAKEIQAELPAYLGNSEGIALIKEVEQLIDLKPGEISYTMKDVPVVQKVNILDLISEVEPSLADVTN